MKILLPIFLSLILLPKTTLKAQHCGFDFVGIIVLAVYADTDAAVIPDLKITLLDSIGNTISMKWDSKTNEDTLKFWRNIKSGRKDNVKNLNPWSSSHRYWFTENNYLIVGGEWLLKQGRKVKIEDVDGEENGGHFETKTVDLNKADLYPLCTGISDWYKGEKYGFVVGFKPIGVNLKKK